MPCPVSGGGDSGPRVSPLQLPTRGTRREPLLFVVQAASPEITAGHMTAFSEDRWLQNRRAPFKLLAADTASSCTGPLYETDGHTQVTGVTCV
jgi:hypothetical protein